MSDPLCEFQGDTDTERQYRAARTAGWDDETARRIVLRANNQAEFIARMKEAEDMRSVAAIAKQQGAFEGVDMYGTLQRFIARGATGTVFRNHVINTMAEADVHTDGTRPEAGGGDIYAKRRAQAKALAKKARSA